MSAHQPKRVLIFRIGQLGDTLVGLPALKALREQYPDTEIDLLYDHHIRSTYVLAESLLANTGVADTFIPYPVGRSPMDTLKAYLAYPGLLLRLRRKHYRIVYHLEPGQKTSLRSVRDRIFFRLAGIRAQVTSSPYRTPRPVRKPLPEVESEVDFYLRVLNKHGIRPTKPPEQLVLLQTGEKEEAEWAAWKTAHPIPVDAQPVAVGVGSKMQAKQWPLDRFESVLNNLKEHHNVYPVFFGGKEDKPDVARLIAALGNGVSACGDLSLKGSIRGLQEMTFYLGNDTGTMHMAVAAGLKCVAVFSARDVPGKWYPYGEGHRVHRVAVDCEGCMLTTCIEQKKKCLTTIRVEDVVASCEHLLADNRRRL